MPGKHPPMQSTAVPHLTVTLTLSLA